MRNILIGLFITASVMTAYAENDVTKFMGIPVDGTKQEMIQQLKAKGFQRSTKEPNDLEGRFNGSDVYIAIVTNGDKVRRIVIRNKYPLGERDVQIEFNNLCYQFDANNKYTPAKDINEFLIPKDEDIRYEIAVHDKRYEAIFYQIPNDSIQLREMAVAKLMSENALSKEDLDNPSKLTESQINITKTLIGMQAINKPVWFVISEFMGEYYIIIYYDNEYNNAHGEDL